MIYKEGYIENEQLKFRNEKVIDYQKVQNNVALAQVEDIEDYFLELVGYYDEDSMINYKDVNCVIIN